MPDTEKHVERPDFTAEDLELVDRVWQQLADDDGDDEPDDDEKAFDPWQY